MKYGTIILEKKEFQLLENLLRSIHNTRDEAYKGSMKKLAEELKSADVRPEEEVPADVIRFNSIAELETFDGLVKKYQLVRPEESNVAMSKVSVLAPLGAALIGYSTGDEITWHFPGGEKKIKILSVETPLNVNNPAPKSIK